MTLRILVLGTGRIGRMHAEYLARRVAGVELVGVYDAHVEGAREVAAELGCLVAESLDEALDFDVDAVAICTSTDTHVDLMVSAAERGLAIFCEKPVSLDAAEVDRGLAAVEAAGVPLQIGFNRRFDPSHRAVANAVASGAIGDVAICSITSRDPAPPPIAYIETSGGLFNDMTIHDFDMARYVTGSDVVEVYARGAVAVDPAIGDAGDIDTAIVMLTHENGALTTINNSRKAVYGYDQRVEAFGNGGMAASHNVHESQAVVATSTGFGAPPLENFFLERYAQSYLDQWSEFVAAVVNGTQPPVTGADGRAPLIIGLAASKSVRENRPVSIAEVDS